MNTVKHAGKKKELLRYHSTATEAVLAEKNADYDQAIILWIRSGKLANNRFNVEWSTKRSQFCMSALRNGWGPENQQGSPD